MDEPQTADIIKSLASINIDPNGSSVLTLHEELRAVQEQLSQLTLAQQKSALVIVKGLAPTIVN